MSPDAKKKKGKNLIYWGNYNTSTITVYSSKGVNGKEKGQITTGLSNPERLFVDKKLNVYATNIGNNTITAYKPGATTPFLTISNGVNSPTGLTVTPPARSTAPTSATTRSRSIQKDRRLLR